MTSQQHPPRLPALTAKNLSLPTIRHAFFTRHGGVSTGVYASLNGGTGSKDAPENVAQNRARMAAHLGIAPSHFLVPYLTHSPDCVILDKPFSAENRPNCDGLATKTRGLALGVTGADCGMILLADEKAGVIAACHAGWRGAFTGVLEATMQAMVTLGANTGNIKAALGPMIAQKSYEVSRDFEAQFLAKDKNYAVFFKDGARRDHPLFDLPGFIKMRLLATGVADFDDVERDTYSEPEDLFSYRRATHLGEPDYGRHVSAIVLV